MGIVSCCCLLLLLRLLLLLLLLGSEHIYAHSISDNNEVKTATRNTNKKKKQNQRHTRSIKRRDKYNTDHSCEKKNNHGIAPFDHIHRFNKPFCRFKILPVCIY